MKHLSHYLLVVAHAILIVLFAGLFYNSAFSAVAVTPRISVGSIYSDNINLTPDHKLYDFITRFSPGFDIGMTSERSMLSLSYTPSYDLYSRFPADNTLSHYANLVSSAQITQTTRIDFNNNFLHSEDPLPTEKLTNESTTIRQGRQPYNVDTATFGILNQFGPQDTVKLGYEYYTFRNNDPVYENSEYHRPSITLDYWLVPNFWGIETEAIYTQNNFEISHDYSDVSGRLRLIRRFDPHFQIYVEYTHEYTDYYSTAIDNYQVYKPLAGFSWQKYANLSFSGNAGYFFQESSHGGKNNGGAVGEIETDYTWQQETVITILGSTGYDQAVYGGENLGFNQFYQAKGKIEHTLSSNLKANIFAAYRRSIYKDQIPERKDNILSTGLDLAYQALPWLFVDLNYSYAKANSTDNQSDYVENRVMITFTLKPRQPYLF